MMKILVTMMMKLMIMMIPLMIAIVQRIVTYRTEANSNKYYCAAFKCKIKTV